MENEIILLASDGKAPRNMGVGSMRRHMERPRHRSSSAREGKKDMKSSQDTTISIRNSRSEQNIKIRNSGSREQNIKIVVGGGGASGGSGGGGGGSPDVIHAGSSGGGGAAFTARRRSSGGVGNRRRGPSQSSRPPSTGSAAASPPPPQLVCIDDDDDGARSSSDDDYVKRSKHTKRKQRGNEKFEQPEKRRRASEIKEVVATSLLTGRPIKSKNATKVEEIDLDADDGEAAARTNIRRAKEEKLKSSAAATSAAPTIGNFGYMKLPASTTITNFGYMKLPQAKEEPKTSGNLEPVTGTAMNNNSEYAKMAQLKNNLQKSLNVKRLPGGTTSNREYINFDKAVVNTMEGQRNRNRKPDKQRKPMPKKFNSKDWLAKQFASNVEDGERKIKLRSGQPKASTRSRSLLAASASAASPSPLPDFFAHGPQSLPPPADDDEEQPQTQRTSSSEAPKCKSPPPKTPKSSEEGGVEAAAHSSAPARNVAHAAASHSSAARNVPDASHSSAAARKSSAAARNVPDALTEIFLPACEKALTAKEYESVEKKCTKYLIALSKSRLADEKLAKKIEEEATRVAEDADNVFTYIRRAIEALKSRSKSSTSRDDKPAGSAADTSHASAQRHDSAADTSHASAQRRDSAADTSHTSARRRDSSADTSHASARRHDSAAAASARRRDSSAAAAASTEPHTPIGEPTVKTAVPPPEANRSITSEQAESSTTAAADGKREGTSEAPAQPVNQVKKRVALITVHSDSGTKERKVDVDEKRTPESEPKVDKANDVATRAKVEEKKKKAKRSDSDDDDGKNGGDPSRKHIRKLEKAMRECAREIKRMEEAEVDFDDDDESAYILTSKYQDRYMMLYKKVAQFKKESARLDRRQDKKFRLECSPYPEVNARIAKMINRKKKSESFPDFGDIYDIFKSANDELRLSLSKDRIRREAADAFVEVGKKLKSRRQEDDLDVLYSYLPETETESSAADPANDNEALRERLDKSEKIGAKKMEEVFKEFTEKQDRRMKEEVKEQEKVADDSRNSAEDNAIHEKNGSRKVPDKEQKESCDKEQEENCDKEQEISCDKEQEENCDKEEEKSCDKEQEEGCDKEQEESCDKEQEENCDKEEEKSCDKEQEKSNNEDNKE